MGIQRLGGKWRGRLSPGSEADSPDEAARKLIEQARTAKPPQGDYRRKSLDLHGWICAKCGREFDENNLHLLTVHHKDGNYRNNPPDGSNWENLCAYCHEDEHTRGA